VQDARAGGKAGFDTRSAPMKNISKTQFTAVLEGAGITHEQMMRLHALFEQRHPEEHQSFLEHLGIPEPEIRAIRERSRKG
jgi:hypothetical protein